MSLICSFDETKNRRKFYRRKDFCRDLKELATEIINYKEEEMTTLTSGEVTLYEKQKVCHICRGFFCTIENKKKEFKLYQKVRDHCLYTGKFGGAAHGNCNLQYKVPKKNSYSIS